MSATGNMAEVVMVKCQRTDDKVQRSWQKVVAAKCQRTGDRVVASKCRLTGDRSRNGEVQTAKNSKKSKGESNLWQGQIQ
jgi:hypothetical protein